MKKIILTLLISLSFNTEVFSLWDFLIIAPNGGMEVTVQSVSIPFEGINFPLDSNRLYSIFAGTIHRRFSTSTGNLIQDSQIVYINETVYSPTPFRMASCFHEANNIGSGGGWRYGFAKYLVTIRHLADGKVFRFYWNTLDSKCGTDNFYGTDYTRDWKFEYNTNPDRYVIETFGVAVDSVLLSEQYKEFKVWKLIYGRNDPFEKNFKVRSTPFPVNVNTATSKIRKFIIGTKIILDTVYKNFGNSDRYGYNTQNDPYYSNIPQIIPYTDTGNTYVTPGKTFDPDPTIMGDEIVGIKIIAESGDSIILKRDKRLWIFGVSTDTTIGGDTLLLLPGSYLQLDTNAEIFKYNGGVVIDSGSYRKWSNLSCQRAFEGTSLSLYGNQDTVNNGGFIVIDGDADLKLGDNTTLTFDGVNTFLWLKPNSNVILGQNAKLLFKNGAYIKANGASFVSYNGSSKWKGIRLENSGEDSITNCSFENTDTCIFVDNVTECEARVKKVIVGNSFDHGMVVFRNIFQCNFSGNIFDASNAQAYLLHINNNVHPYNFDVCAEAENPPASDFAINITNNSFTGGVIQIYLNCLASSFTPFYITKNYFNGALVLPRIGILTNKSSGIIKNNTFTSDDYDYSFKFYQSDFSLFGNTTSSEYLNIELNTSSGANLGPVSSSGSEYWYGGHNDLTSTGGDNINFDLGSDLLIDSGKNCLTIPEECLHILGAVSGNCTGRTFAARKNYWNFIPPLTYIDCSSTNIPLLYTPYISYCVSSEEEPDDYELTDMGDGIIDSVIITSSGGGGGNPEKNNLSNQKIESDDEDYYAIALHKKNQKDYEEAIDLLKNILDNYDTSRFVNSAVSELFLNYTLSDTSKNQLNTTELFTELEEYLEEKMEHYQSNSSFIEKAYTVYLMCLTKSLDYNDAILGYENIMLNHPDTTRRLLASWDRSAVVLLQQGSGGGDNLSPEQRLKKLFRDEPVHKLVNKVFKRMMMKEIANQKVVRGNDNRKKMQNIENRITRFNPGTAEELDQKISKDFELLLALEITQSHKEQNLVPKEYKLNQNYPNPFNPMTTISYEIPTDGLVKLKIFDITGREVMTLVNELKSAGSYSIRFDGQNFASGVYFYKIEAGSFIEIKRMMLIK